LHQDGISLYFTIKTHGQTTLKVLIPAFSWRQNIHGTLNSKQLHWLKTEYLPNVRPKCHHHPKIPEN